VVVPGASAGGVSVPAHQASLCLYLSARHEDAQSQLLEHHPAQHPWRFAFAWVGQTKIWLVSLEQMAAVTQQEKLILHNTLRGQSSTGEATAFVYTIPNTPTCFVPKG